MQRIPYRWVVVTALGVTEAVSYGVLAYAFPVFIAPMALELGWSQATITGAFSVALLVSGAAAVPVGRWIDAHGARGVMTTGTLTAVAVLIGWSRVTSVAGFYAIAVALGLAMAGVLYEPAFAVVTEWFDRGRGRALTLLTVLGGLASVVFVPVATHLVGALGWRSALLRLAAVLLLVTLPPHLLLLRRRPVPAQSRPVAGGADDVAPGLAAATADGSVHGRVRSASFGWLAVAFGLSAVITTGMTVHLIPLLIERGSTPAFAAAAMGGVGLMALPGRVVLTPLGDRLRRTTVTAGIFVLTAAAIGALLSGSGTAAVWAFVVLFGAGFGAITPARAALIADFYGRRNYGSINGVLAFVIAVCRAAAPVGLSLLHSMTGGYDIVLLLLLCMAAVCAVAVHLSGSAAARCPDAALAHVNSTGVSRTG